jgi:hypothetical protein
MTETFRLAPMAPFIRWLTWLLWALPVGFAVAALVNPRGVGLLWIALLLVGLYGALWVWWRPGRFEVSAQGLALVFPGRRAMIPISDIESASVVDPKAFRQQFGLALRVGAGGLWGGFGWLWTSKGWVEFYVSALDRYVLIRRRRHIPLLISPEEPQRMAAMLERQLPAPRR